MKHYNLRHNHLLIKHGGLLTTPKNNHNFLFISPTFLNIEIIDKEEYKKIKPLKFLPYRKNSDSEDTEHSDSEDNENSDSEENANSNSENSDSENSNEYNKKYSEGKGIQNKNKVVDVKRQARNRRYYLKHRKNNKQ